MNFLCAAEMDKKTQVIVYIIIGVLLVGMLILPYFTNKKRNQQYMDMLSSIRVGDLVKTAGGVIGRVTKITDKGEIKTIILETGSKSEKSYMEFDISSIYCVLNSTKAEKKPEEVENKEAADETEKTEEVKETAETEVKEPETKTEKPAKKAKKTTSKKTSK